MTAAASVRHATPADAAVLAELSARTFVETFAHTTSAANMAAHVAGHYGVAIQAAELADPKIIYLIAEVNGATAGYAMLIARQAPPDCITGPDPVEILRFYVDQPWHGTGVAHTLMVACEAEARGLGGRTLWLGVWEHNTRAQRFYGKFGFVDVGSHVFPVGNDPQVDRIIARPLY